MGVLWKGRKDPKVSVIKDEIILRGLKENNLKNIDLNILKGQITGFTGFLVQERVL